MIVEQRTYTMHVGKVPEYLSLYEQEGMAIQKSILGNMLGYFFCEIGTQNQVVHMWGYEDFEDRTKRRTLLFQDEGWKAYIAKVRPLVVHQENKILIPAPFSPIGGTR